jgi:GNAT superfamily N-acetyltransferase
VSVPPALRRFVQEAVQDFDAHALLTPDAIHDLFGNRVTRLVGPSYQGYVERPGFRPRPAEHVRLLSAPDRPAQERLRDACDPAEWEDSGISLDREPLFGYVSQGDVLAVAGVIPWSPYAANPAVITHPGSRGQGFGTAVVSAAMAHILDQGSVVLYQTLLENRAAVRMATALGCQEYARMMYIDLVEQ